MNEIVKKNGIKFGVISGVVGILATTLMYLIDLSLFVNLWVGLGVIVIYIIIGCVLLSTTKKELNGIMTFKEAFTAYFVSALIGITISTLFNILLFNFIDTEARNIISDLFIKSQLQMMEKFGAPASEINKAAVKLQENSQFSIKGQFFGFLQSLVGSIIFGLILAAIFKSKPSYKE